MATLVALVASSCLLALAAVTVADDSDVLCCMADNVKVRQVQTYVASHMGNYDFGMVTSDLSYDAANEREVYHTKRSDNLGPAQDFVYFLLYQTNTIYAYHNQSGQCVQYPLDSPFNKRCVPTSAIVMDQLHYGAGSDEEKIDAMRVQYNITRADGSIMRTMLTLTSECVPILEEFVMLPEGGILSESIEYTNMQIGGVSEADFELPAACQSAIVAPPMRYPNLVFV